MQVQTSKLSDTHNSGVSKSKVYGWQEVKEFGEFKMLDKRLLAINHDYQRELNNKKANEIAKSFDFVCFNALTVADIGNGLYEVLDGQHRLAGAMKRSEIQQVPCLVYRIDSLSERAKAFLDMQVLRKPVSSLDKFKAQVVSQDKAAMQVAQWLSVIGRRADKSTGKKTNGAKVLGWIGRLYKAAQQSPDCAQVALMVSHQLFSADAIPERVFIALLSIEQKLTLENKSLTEKRTLERILKVGGYRIALNINRHCALYASGASENVMRRAAVEEINKGLRIRLFDFDSEA